MTRCQMCGRPVGSSFDHVDVDCTTISEDLDDTEFETAVEALRNEGD